MRNKQFVKVNSFQKNIIKIFFVFSKPTTYFTSKKRKKKKKLICFGQQLIKRSNTKETKICNRVLIKERYATELITTWRTRTSFSQRCYFWAVTKAIHHGSCSGSPYSSWRELVGTRDVFRSHVDTSEITKKHTSRVSRGGR